MESETIINGSAQRLLELGIAGVFIITLILAIYFLWKHLQRREELARKRTDEFMEITRKYVANETEQSNVMKANADVMVELKNLIVTKLLN